MCDLRCQLLLLTGNLFGYMASLRASTLTDCLRNNDNKEASNRH